MKSVRDHKKRSPHKATKVEVRTGPRKLKSVRDLRKLKSARAPYERVKYMEFVPALRNYTPKNNRHRDVISGFGGKMVFESVNVFNV